MIITKGSINSTFIKLYDWNDKEFGIPIFQRFYSWKEKEVAQLMDDLLRVVDNPTAQLYLLDFIFYRENKEGHEIIKIADGQQRLVTVNNLIKAIKDVADEEGLAIHDIKTFSVSYDIFANQDKYNTHFLNYPTAPFKKVYLKLYEFVKKHKHKINDFIDIIKNNIFVYVKECASADDAFNIFQQINTGGKPLSKDEVIKTALDQYSASYGIKLDTTKIKEVRQYIISYYKLKTKDFDKNFDNMEIITFLRDSVTKDKSTFQDFVDTVELIKKAENSPVKYVINYINRATLQDVLNILMINKIDIDTNRDYLEKVMIPLCMMSIVLTLNGGSPTTFRYLLTDVINLIKAKSKPSEINKKLIDTINADPITWQMKLSDFSSKLGDVNTSRGIKKSLLILDVIYRNVSGRINVAAINLEHIYPQNPHPDWAGKGWPSHRPLQKEIIDNIGNYLLLAEEVNKSISNQYLTNKLPKYEAIIKKDIILQTPINTVDFARFETEQLAYINERKDYIASSIQHNLPLGMVLIKK